MITLEGLLSDPRMLVGLGLLSARRDSRVDPYQAIFQGMNAAQQNRNAYDDTAFQTMQRDRQKQDWSREDKLNALLAPKELEGPPRPGTPDGQQDPSLMQMPTPDQAVQGLLAYGDPKDKVQLLTGLLGQHGSAPRMPAAGIQYDDRLRALQAQDAQDGGSRATQFQETMKRMFPDRVFFDPSSGTGVNYGRDGAGPTYFGDPSRFGQGRGTVNAEEENAKASTGFQLAYGPTRQQNDMTIQGLTDLRAKVASLPGQGPLDGTIRAKLQADYQDLNAQLRDAALTKIGQLKQSGVSLSPMTERDLQVLFETSAEMSNDREANLKIIDRRINGLKRLNSALDYQRNFLRQGGRALDYTGYNPQNNNPDPSNNNLPAAPQVDDSKW